MGAAPFPRRKMGGKSSLPGSATQVRRANEGLVCLPCLCSPRSERRRSRLRHRLPDHPHRLRRAREDQLGRDPHHTVPRPPEHTVPPRVRPFPVGMVAAIHLHHEPDPGREEVHDELADDRLPPERHPETAPAELLPQPRFGRRGRPPHPQGSLGEDALALPGLNAGTSGHGDLLRPAGRASRHAVGANASPRTRRVSHRIALHPWAPRLRAGRAGASRTGRPRRIGSELGIPRPRQRFRAQARGAARAQRSEHGLVPSLAPPRGAARLAPAEAKLKKPKGFAPLAADELVELASWLERVPVPRRAELGGWLLERTWTSRDPRLWAAIGRLGARVPVYASVHHVVGPPTVERWLDHLLREKWPEMPTAAAAAAQMARVTDDRARDVNPGLRATIAGRLLEVGAPSEWIRAVRELVPVAAGERAERFGEGLPVGLRLVEG